MSWIPCNLLKTCKSGVQTPFRKFFAPVRKARSEGHEIQRERKAQCNMSDSYSKPRYDAFPGELTLEEGISATWGGQRGINQSSA